ncbi:MAG: hypothetical protein JXB36_15760 [Gammaproteobacteria bacterium]|nr:hypothetical protein [Gammaproteobacteria bacterium]
MTYVIFVGDMLVMAFMTVMVVWFSVRAKDERIDAIARIPLDDAPFAGETGADDAHERSDG